MTPLFAFNCGTAGVPLRYHWGATELPLRRHCAGWPVPMRVPIHRFGSRMSPPGSQMSPPHGILRNALSPARGGFFSEFCLRLQGRPRRRRHPPFFSSSQNALSPARGGHFSACMRSSLCAAAFLPCAWIALGRPESAWANWGHSGSLWVVFCRCGGVFVASFLFLRVADE